MKAGEGLAADRTIQRNLLASMSAELPRGAYWYYNNKYNPKRQAEFFSSIIGEASLELGFWLDLEDRVGGGFMGWKNWYNFLVRLKELRPTSLIGIYTGHYYWVEFTQGSGIPKTSLDYFKQFPVWLASYSNEPFFTLPWGSDWKIWQFTDLLDGKKYGAESIELDGNYFKGTPEDFKQFFKLGNYIPPIIVPPAETPMAAATYNCKALYKVKVRPDPSTANATEEWLLANELFQISEIVPDRLDPTNPLKKWGHIVGGAHDNKYTALEYPGNSVPISTYTPIPQSLTQHQPL